MFVNKLFHYGYLLINIYKSTTIVNVSFISTIWNPFIFNLKIKYYKRSLEMWVYRSAVHCTRRSFKSCWHPKLVLVFYLFIIYKLYLLLTANYSVWIMSVLMTLSGKSVFSFKIIYVKSRSKSNKFLVRAVSCKRGKGKGDTIRTKFLGFPLRQ